jgi:DNA-binding beta-propeller fold protein YncE
MVLDASGHLIIVNSNSNKILKCPAAPGSRQGNCDTAGGVHLQKFQHPTGIALDASGDYIIADTDNHRIQKCDPGKPWQACTTVAGTGSSGNGATQLKTPRGIALDASGDYIIADQSNNRIQKCPAASPGSACTTVASGLAHPYSVALDASGDYIIADTDSHTIQKCPASGAACTTVDGVSGSPGSAASQLRKPHGVAVDASGDYIIADTDNHRIQKCPAGGNPSECITLSGTGVSGSGAKQLNSPAAVVLGVMMDSILAE